MGKIILPTLGYVAALSLVFCIFLVIRKHEALLRAQQCEGSVIGYAARRGTKGGTTYALKINYHDDQGRAHDFTTKTSSKPPARTIGEKVIVFHYPDGSPPSVLLFGELYLGYWIWFCVGICAAGCLVAPRILNFLYVR